MIRIYTTLYPSKEREAEFREAILKNIENPLIGEIYIFNEGGGLDFSSEKIKIIPSVGRPLFKAYLEYAQTESSHSDINIIANTDIYFDDSLQLLKKLGRNDLFTLSRWEEDVLYECAYSQDCWIFRGKPKEKLFNAEMNFGLGYHGIDNRMAYEFNKAGYNVSNPSRTIKSFHVHDSQYRIVDDSKRIPPPYDFVEPTALKPFKVLHIALNQLRQETLCNALASLGEYKEIDWILILNTHGKDYLQDVIIQTCKSFKPDLVFMQIQTPDIVDENCIRQMSGYIVNWNGDVRNDTPLWSKGIAPYCHTMFTNERDNDNIRALGCRADYLQIGFNEHKFKRHGTRGSGHDIVFMGNNNDSTFELSLYRRQMVDLLSRQYGAMFGVYGFNWGNGKNLMYREAEEANVYNHSKIAINLSHYNILKYSSDRLWRIMGSGCFALSYYYEGIEDEFIIGEHLDVWRTFDELLEKIQFYLQNDQIRQKIATAGYKHVHNNCTWAHRVSDLMKLTLGV